MQDKVIGIIGGGQCGTMFLHDFLHHYRPGPSPLTIHWMDTRGAFGSAAAFDTSLPDSLLLSSPSYMVTPSACKPKLFHDYLSKNHGVTDLGACLPRKIFGAFLRDLAATLEAQARDLGIKLVKTNTQIHNISKTESGRFLIEGTGKVQKIADRIVLSPGPAGNSALDYLNGRRGYISNPADLECFARSEIDFSDPSINILGFGPGNSFFDAMSLLENELGFKGKYILVSPEKREPWAITRERVIPDDVRYGLKYFVAEKLPCPATYSALSEALQRDLRALIPEKENPWRFGREYPLYYVGNFAMDFFKQWVAHHKPNALAEAQSREAFRMIQRDALREVTAVVPRQVLDTFDRLSLSKRLFTVPGRVLTDHITKEGDFFKVPIRLNEDQCKYRFCLHSVLNCMPYKRDWNTEHPDMQGHLLRKLETSGLIRKKQNHSVAVYDFTHALSNGVVLTGASINPVWGVHLAAIETNLAAQKIAADISAKPEFSPYLDHVA